MEKEIFIKKVITDDENLGPRKGRLHDHHEYHGHSEHNVRHDKGRGIHVNGGRRDHEGPHFEEGCFTGEHKPPRIRRERLNLIMKTKMFTSKKDLVEYVNEIGELGHKIDIFKIEEDLYKVVVLERII